MPYQMVPPGTLSRGRPRGSMVHTGGMPTSGAMVSPAANELPALAQSRATNYHLPQPRFSDQMEPLARPMLDDPEVQGAVLDSTQLPPVATRGDVVTKVEQKPAQAEMRVQGLDLNNSGPQMNAEIVGAASLVREVTAPQQAQSLGDQRRRANAMVSQMGYAETTGSLADAQQAAQAFRINRSLEIMDPQALATLDHLEARMMRPGSSFAIGA